MKRKIAFILALCMLMTLAMPMVAFAADEVTDPVWEVINEGEEAIGCANLTAAKAALKAGGTLKLLKDFTYTNSAIASIESSNFTLDGNGNTLTYVCTTTSSTKAVVSLSGTGKITVKNLTIALGSSNAANLQVSGLEITGAGADVTLENCHFKVNRIAVWVKGENAKLTINSGSYESITNGSVVQLAKAGVECTVNGGTFTQNVVHYIFRAETFKTLTINGGTFIRSKANAVPIIYAVNTIGGEINISGGHFKYLANGNSSRYSLMELTHHKVTISGGLFELYDNKTAIGLNGSTYSASSVTADQKGSLAITGGVFIHNGTLLDTKLNDYFTSVTVDDAVSRYGMAGKLGSYYTEDAGITMDEGAAVRLVSKAPEDSGIRFTSSITAEMVATAKANAKDGKVTYGTILVPTEKLATTDFTVPALEANAVKYQNIVADEGLEGSDETGYTLKCALIRIKASHYDMALSARAYVSYVDANGRTVYIYSAYNEALNSRSISYVAEKALADTTQNYSPAQIEILNGYLTKSPAESGTVASEDSNS